MDLTKLLLDKIRCCNCDHLLTIFGDSLMCYPCYHALNVNYFTQILFNGTYYLYKNNINIFNDKNLNKIRFGKSLSTLMCIENFNLPLIIDSDKICFDEMLSKLERLSALI